MQLTKANPPDLPKEHLSTPPFKWRERTGTRVLVTEMPTRHLFFTLRMIWNHTMPMKARLRPYREYTFGPVYTQEYLQTAVKEIYTELRTRADLKPHWQQDLQRMQNYFTKNRQALQHLD